MKWIYLFIEAIMISDIARWQNPGYALSVCSWLRLDALENPCSPGNNYRRQFFKYIKIYTYYRNWFHPFYFVHYSLSSNKGHGFEGFFLSDGTLVISVTWKKEYTTAMVHSVILNDHQWHSVCISFNPSRWENFQRHYLNRNESHPFYFQTSFWSKSPFGFCGWHIAVDGECPNPSSWWGNNNLLQ